MGIPSSLTLRARYIFPVSGNVISNGWITVADGRVVALGEGESAGIDLGNVAIVPAFVNAHTHLELGALPGDPWRGAESGVENQLDWLRSMIGWRKKSSPEAMKANVAQNIREVLASGTGTVADITTQGLSWNATIASPLRGVVFSEIIGLKRSRGLETSAAAFNWLAEVRPMIAEHDPRLRSGLSPHAPYSTSGWLYQRSTAAHLPLTTHLAEMPEEVELLATRQGPLRDLLEEIGAWDDGWQPLGDRPADYVRKGDLRQADWLIAHGNYLEPSDFWQLRQHAAPSGQRVAVAYCPRTHARFGHAPHRFLEMIKRNIIVCLGSDSRATAPTLSILDEMRFLSRRFPDLNGALILTMGTMFGAWALRLENVCGSLEPQKAADLAIVRLPDREAADAHSLLFHSEEPVVATLIGGDVVYRTHDFVRL